MISEKERGKQYHAQRGAESHCDDAHIRFKQYMRTIGKAARCDKQSAINQVRDDLIHARVDATLSLFMAKCLDLAKCDNWGNPIPYARGNRSDDEGGGIGWVVYNIADLPSDIEVDGNEDLAYVLTGWVPYYSGPGRGFASEPYYIKSRTRILVKQFRGLDI